MTKVDEDHPNFIGKILCSKGIGAGYIKRIEAKKHIYKKGETTEKTRKRHKTTRNTLGTRENQRLYTTRNLPILTNQT